MSPFHWKQCSFICKPFCSNSKQRPANKYIQILYFNSVKPIYFLAEVKLDLPSHLERFVRVFPSNSKKLLYNKPRPLKRCSHYPILINTLYTSTVSIIDDVYGRCLRRNVDILVVQKFLSSRLKCLYIKTYLDLFKMHF